MMNVTTKKIYWHPKELRIYTMIGLMVSGIGLYTVPRVGNWTMVRLGDNVYSMNLGFVFVMIGIMVGVLSFMFFLTTRYTPNYRRYLLRHPKAKEVHDVSSILEIANGRVVIVTIIALIFVTISVIRFNYYLNNFDISNFQSFVRDTVGLVLLAFYLSLIKDIIFIRREVKRYRIENKDTNPERRNKLDRINSDDIYF
jgi:glucose uptake protein GlcU